MKRLPLLVGLLFSLCACASGPQPPAPPKLPYHSWYVGLAAPRFMEVWVETVDVLDQRGLPFFRVSAGVAGYTSKPEGWHKGGGAMKPVNNVDLPQRIFLRWQSLVEPQAYKIRISIPQWVRDEMVRPERVFCEGSKEWRNDYRKMITLGMAPGGIVKVWVGGACLGFKEVGRFQADPPAGTGANHRPERQRQPLPGAAQGTGRHRPDLAPAHRTGRRADGAAQAEGV